MKDDENTGRRPPGLLVGVYGLCRGRAIDRPRLKVGLRDARRRDESSVASGPYRQL